LDEGVGLLSSMTWTICAFWSIVPTSVNG
jgi:hypothetical protein